jgi:hypothetical protein
MPRTAAEACSFIFVGTPPENPHDVVGPMSDGHFYIRSELRGWLSEHASTLPFSNCRARYDDYRLLDIEPPPWFSRHRHWIYLTILLCILAACSWLSLTLIAHALQSEQRMIHSLIKELVAAPDLQQALNEAKVSLDDDDDLANILSL